MAVDLLKIADDLGTPLYIYDFDAMADRLRQLRRLFDERIKLYYAVKANPNIHLLTGLRPLVDGLDISSGGELQQALLAGYRGSDLSFAGPGKTASEIAKWRYKKSGIFDLVYSLFIGYRSVFFSFTQTLKNLNSSIRI